MENTSDPWLSQAVEFQETINQSIEHLDTDLQNINLKIHSNPELGYEEHQAHSNLVSFLQSQDLNVTPHAHGLETAFSSEYGRGGRLVVFNAEYDALPGIGHACGHNLIATGSLAAYLATVSVLKKHSEIQGRVRLLGTPAEEGGGGKIKLIDAGAYAGVDACFMTHPFSIGNNEPFGTCMASSKFRVTFTGKPAHAAAAPEEGINALDAAVLAYSGISMLRQQTKGDQRIQGVILEGGDRPNVITPKSLLDYNVRSGTVEETRKLQVRVTKCFDGAAIATGCEVEIKETNTYADLRPSRPLCVAFSEIMNKLEPSGKWEVGEKPAPGAYSTDQGNVSHVCPSFHGLYSIPVENSASNHTHGFTAAAGTEEAHRLTLLTSKGMAGVALRVLTDDAFAREAMEGFKMNMGH